MTTTVSTTCPDNLTKEECEKEMASLESGAKKKGSVDDLDSEFDEDEPEPKPPPPPPEDDDEGRLGTAGRGRTGRGDAVGG